MMEHVGQVVWRERVSCSRRDLLNVGNNMCCSWTFRQHSSCFVYDYVFVKYYCICGVVAIHDGTSGGKGELLTQGYVYGGHQ